MSENQKPEDFKFENSKFVLNIEARGKEDGHTISSSLSAEIQCEGDFALSVIDSMFERDPKLEELFKDVIMTRSLKKLIDDNGESLFERLKEAIGSDEEEDVPQADVPAEGHSN